MLRSVFAVYLREMLILKKRLNRQIPSWSVSPLLYLIAFSYAAGHTVQIDGHSYAAFLIPGLIAMSSMTQAFAIASEINIARFYWQTFEEIQTSPVSKIAYVTGEVLAGITRALLSVGVIMVIGLIFGVKLQYNLAFLTGVLLNSFVFASLAVGLAMVVKNHADQGVLTSFVITPMAFLGGTVFPLDRLLSWAASLLSLLPLTHASKAIRNACLTGQPDMDSWLTMLMIGIAFFLMAVFLVEKAKD